MEIGNIEFKRRDKNIVHAEINYPREKENEIDTIEIGLYDVRASDDIRVKYDFDRDGWVIYQPRYYYVEEGNQTYHENVEWIESAFLQAWEHELEEDEKHTYKPK